MLWRGQDLPCEPGTKEEGPVLWQSLFFQAENRSCQGPQVTKRLASSRITEEARAAAASQGLGLEIKSKRHRLGPDHGHRLGPHLW